MRVFTRQLLPLLFLASVVFAHGQDAPAPPPPPKITVPNVFSYQPPAGWSTVQLVNVPYPTALEGAQAGKPDHLKAMISVNTDTSRYNLTQWCSQSLEKNKAQFAALNARVGELELFHTDNPVITGFRAPVDLAASAHGRSIHYVMYFFAGAGDTKIAVTCACAAADAARYDPIFEAAMKTFVPY
jgi:hypothetical protein